MTNANTGQTGKHKGILPSHTMSKIWIIVKSEFLRRVRSKWFIFITLLAPLLLIAFMALPVVVAVLAEDEGSTRIAVVDETGVLLSHLEEAETDVFQFVRPTEPDDAVRDAVRDGTYDGFLHLPIGLLAEMGEATYYSSAGRGLSLPPRLRSLVGKAVVQQRLAQREVPPDVLEIVNSDVSLRTVKLTDEGEEADNTIANSIVGYIMGFMIYITVLIYGALVMQSVIEDKSSRVVEVMMASVRPFQLLMGKVLGIGAVGLVQMTLWGAIIVGLSLGAGSVLSLFLDPSAFNLPADASQEVLLAEADIALPSISAGLFVWFVLFFLGGYLLFASLYAAVGSAVEQQQDAQALMLPLTFLIILPILFLFSIIENPNAGFSVVLSMIPFFSPILMIVRVAVTEVPFWQVALSYVLLISGFVASIWVSSRIYRVGILMYGKKASLKDMVKWVRYA